MTASTASSGFGRHPVARSPRTAVQARARSALSSLGHRRTVPGWAIASSSLSPVVLVGAWVIADGLQPATYSPMRQTMSVLAGHAATDRWLVTGAVFLVSVGTLVTALGLTGVRTSARVVLAVSGMSGIGIAASPEPAHGTTLQHLAWVVVGGVALAIWPAFVARRRPARPRSLVLSVHGSATATAVFVALLGWVFIEARGGSSLGLAERVTIGAQLLWPLFVALAVRRSQPHSGQPIRAELARTAEIMTDSSR